MRKRFIYKVILIPVFILRSLFCLAQLPDSASRVELLLHDSTRVILFKMRDDRTEDHLFYYQPVNLRIALKGGNPEFSFLSYDSDDDGQTDGAIMHMLLTWGLTDQQTEEAVTWLKTHRDSLAYIAGAGPVLPADGGSCLYINSENPLGIVLNNSLKSKGSVPLSPGEKMALSFMFSAENTRKMENAIKNPVKFKDIIFEINFKIGVNGIPFLLKGDFQRWMETIQGEGNRI